MSDLANVTARCSSGHVTANTMPILRNKLHEQPGETTLSMAFVRFMRGQ